jgi:hypothetical protein
MWRRGRWLTDLAIIRLLALNRVLMAALAAAVVPAFVLDAAKLALSRRFAIA